MLADLQQLSDETAKLAAAPLWPLTDPELTDCLHTAYRLEQIAATLQARLVHEATTRGLPTTQGHRTTRSWLRSQLRIDPQPARELADRATLLHHHPAIEQALLDSHLNARQATAIATTLEAIPRDLANLDQTGLDQAGSGPVDPGESARIVDQAQNTLIEMAARLPAFQLRRVGERILAYVAPHLADQADQAALARQEARAHARRSFTLSAPVNGMIHLRGTLGVEDAATLQAALHPLCTPTPGDKRSPAQQRADALIDICRLALRTNQLPDDGGQPPQVTVTVAYDPLTQALGTATTDTGHRLSATTARRLACDARILPLTLDGPGQILDAGRSRRLATGVLRQALAVRDRGCAHPDCDHPPRWTDAHHLTAWADGGTTTLNNLVLLCRHHHRLIHHPTAGWKIRLGPDQLPDFIPPPDIDPQQHPRRNLYHPRP
ncbi:HNH endonuclease signature motif containing protein [Paractinoplanes durhamensis]|uniref:HNH endonuclease signature motif containing protein n=1 Tax=Paractinoplanes durhamensis TaxID=113563 RepID=UPI0031D3C125